MSQPHQLTILTGASRGMGRAIAQALLAPGQRLLCIARRPDPRLDEEARAAGAELVQWAQNLADAPAAAQRLGEWLQQERHTSWARATLINNAALLPEPGTLETQSPATLSAALRVGLEAPMLLSATFLRETASWNAERKILNISSGLGRRAMAGSANYCAVKAGLDHLSRALALEQQAQANGAKIVSLAPGVIDTDMQVQLRGADPARFSEQQRFEQLKTQGLLDTPQQAAAKIVAYLQRADFGQTVVADIRD
jgi:NAD(P)-dependent dehydrogenase (short-subunit alcohol dehydrogenase family)